MVQGVQFRRGTTAQHAVFTGQPGEITVDSDKKIVVIHDGSAVGGYEVVGAGSTQRITNKDVNATSLNVTGITTISVNSSSDALRITQTGSGNALVVEDSANPDATPFVITSDGSLGIGTVSSPTSVYKVNIHDSYLRFTNSINGTGVIRGLLLGYDGTTTNNYLISSLDNTIRIQTTSSTQPVIIQPDANRSVGIGSTIPTSKLDVIGNARIIGVTTITGNLNAAGNYYVKLARLTNQTILTGGDTLIAFTATSDTNGWYSGITTRTIPTVAGTYNVSAMLNWQAGASSFVNQSNIQIRKNGSTFALSIVGVQTHTYTLNACGIVTMNGTTDYIDFTAYTSNPTSQVVTGTADGAWTKMEIFKIN